MKFSDHMHEENPVGNALIRLGPQVFRIDERDPYFPHRGDRKDVSLFVAAKMFGTILALGTVLLLFQKWPLGAQVVVVGLALFQCLLMLYIFQ